MKTSDFTKRKCSRHDLTFSLMVGFYCFRCGLCAKTKQELLNHVKKDATMEVSV